MLDLLPKGPIHRFVDIGCGPGTLSAALSARHPEAEIVALDLRLDDLLAARQLFADAVPRALVLQGNALSLPVASASADVAALVSVLHWVHPHQERAIAEVARILAPGGLFLLANMLRRPGVRQFTVVIDQLAREAARRAGIAVPPAHVDFTLRHMTFAGLRRVLEHFGLDLIASRVLFSRRAFDDGDDFTALIRRTMPGFLIGELPLTAQEGFYQELTHVYDEILAAKPNFRVPIVSGHLIARKTS